MKINEPQSTGDLVKGSLLYAEAEEERQEIERHKWYESQKAGHDIGLDLARVDWRLKHRAGWRKAWREKHVRSRFKM